MASCTLLGLHTEITTPITDGSSVSMRPVLAAFLPSILRPTPQRAWATVEQVSGCLAVRLQLTPQATYTLSPATAYSTAPQRLVTAFSSLAPRLVLRWPIGSRRWVNSLSMRLTRIWEQEVRPFSSIKRPALIRIL